MEKTAAMVLAGGRGKRMDIFCQRRPKPILSFAGNYRVIDFTLSNCVNSQIGNMAILVDYQRSTMTEYLNQWSSKNAGSGDLSILPPKMGSYSGTAGAVYQNLEYLMRLGGERVLILAGDHIYKMDYREMLSFHDESGADATIAVIRVPVEQAYRFGTITAEAGGRVTEFVEKSSNPRSYLASMGIYVFNNHFLAKCLAEDTRESNSLHDFGYSILPRIVERSRVFAYEFNGYWQDIGTVEAYYEANLQLLNSNPGFDINDNWPIFTGSPALPLTAQNNFGKINNSMISPGCSIEGYVENSILSPGVRVEKGAQVINSVVMANTSIGENSVIDRCILDEGVDIGTFCQVGLRNEPTEEPYGITMVGENVNVPHRTTIGCKSKILPGLRLSDLNTWLIAPGSVISAPSMA